MARRRFSKPKKIIEPHVFQPKDLKAFAERLERIDRDMAALREDRKQILIEADGKGFHKKIILRAMTDLRRDQKMSEGERECLDCYRDALTGTPLAQAAAKAAKSEEKKPAETAKSNRKAFQNFAVHVEAAT